jgi:hypothetical protein
MVADQAARTGTTGAARARGGRWRGPLIGMAAATAVVAFGGWIAVLALTLPSRHLADHWDVTWVGFDVMLLIALLATGWAVARRRSWAGTGLVVSAVMLTCDAWFDVTTASGATATLVSIGFAAGVELPAAGLAWAAATRHRRYRAAGGYDAFIPAGGSRGVRIRQAGRRPRRASTARQACSSRRGW